MNQKNSFISRGQTRAVTGIKEKAEREIASVESSDLSKEEKTIKIKRIEDIRDEEIKQLKSSRILWSNR